VCPTVSKDDDLWGRGVSVVTVCRQTQTGRTTARTLGSFNSTPSSDTSRKTCAFSFSKMAFDIAKVASPVAATAGGAFVSLGSFALEQQPQAVSLNDPSSPAATMILGRT
jgi:hypothetical protein